jgi:predicted nucleic acid-binding protein
MVKEIVCDTSTIITLFSAYHISENKDMYLEELKKYTLIAPNSVRSELEYFTKRDNDLGLFARESLSYKIDFQSVKVEDIERYKKVLGVAGRRGITDCDIACLSLAIERNIPLFIDDFKAQFHFSSFFDEHDIFFGILLVCSILAEFMNESEIFSFVFDKLVPNRWGNISLHNLLAIKHAVSEYLAEEG